MHKTDRIHVCVCVCTYTHTHISELFSEEGIILFTVIFLFFFLLCLQVSSLIISICWQFFSDSNPVLLIVPWGLLMEAVLLQQLNDKIWLLSFLIPREPTWLLLEAKKGKGLLGSLVTFPEPNSAWQYLPSRPPSSFNYPHLAKNFLIISKG